MASSPLLLASLLFLGPATDDGELVPLRSRTYRDFDLVLPVEAFRPVSGDLTIPHDGGEGFATGFDGGALRVDTDGDGTLDVTVQAEPDDLGVRRAVLALRGTREGKAFSYPVRFEDEGTGWHWASSGAMVGKIGKTKVQIVDLDGNGCYADHGVDALVLGTGKDAAFLSSLIHVDGVLHELEVAADGSAMSVRPWTGETGVLDFRSELETKGKLLSAIVLSEDGRCCFDLARAQEGLPVPVGRYTLHTGRIGLGASTVRVDPGRSAIVEVRPSEETVVDWGGPVRAEFQYAEAAGLVQFHPDAVWYYGAAGERYLDWQPIGESPEFTIKDADEGSPIAVAQFPGSCCGTGFVPVTVSVPRDTRFIVEMVANTWAFGTLRGSPRLNSSGN